MAGTTTLATMTTIIAIPVGMGLRKQGCIKRVWRLESPTPSMLRRDVMDRQSMKDLRGAAPLSHRERSGRARLRLVGESDEKHFSEVRPAEAKLPLAASRPALSVGVEPFVAIAKELPPLFMLHHEEVEQDGFGLPLDPDWDTMYNMSQFGRLHIDTARYQFGKRAPLVGYIINFVYPSVYNKSSLTGEVHSYFLHPAYRDEPHFVMRWFRHNDKHLEKMGCVKIYGNTRGGKERVIFKRLGYSLQGESYARMV